MIEHFRLNFIKETELESLQPIQYLYCCYFSCLTISFVPAVLSSLKITATEICSRRRLVVGLGSQNGFLSVKKAMPGSLFPGNPYLSGYRETWNPWVSEEGRGGMG